MLTRLLILLSTTCIPTALTDSSPIPESPEPIHNASISELNTEFEEESELTQEAFLSDEEEPVSSPKKVTRPKIVQLPKKNSTLK
jgi:hypothetical protein